MGHDCKIKECNKPAVAKGLCSRHYTRQRRHGSPDGGGIDRGLTTRFLEAAFDHQNKIECLIYPYSKDAYGRAVINKDGRLHKVSRLVCETVHGPSPEDKPLALHSCGMGNKGCVNPNHLRWGNSFENSQDAKEHGVLAKGERTGNSILTEVQVLRIAEMAKQYSVKEISEKLALPQGAVKHVVRGSSWSWLTGINE